MAKVKQRSWKVPGQRTRRRAWGYVSVEEGKHRKTCSSPGCRGCQQVRVFKSDWSREDAENALAAFTLKLQQPKAPASGITFGQAVERYLNLKSRKRSLHTDRSLIGHLKAEFGVDTPLTDITASRISEYKAKRLAVVRRVGNGERAVDRPLAPATVNRALALVRHLLRLAHEEWGVLDAVPRIRLEKEPQGRLRWLTQQEATKLLVACRLSRNDALADLVEFALFTGVRRSEALGLTWDRVDRARGVIRLEVTKSGRRREVPLSANADAVLARRWREDANRYVFGRPKWDTFRSAWKYAVARAGLDDVTFHTLRHSFASWLVQRGRTLKEVQEALGHQSITMTLRYSHLAPDHLRAAVAVLDGVLPASHQPVEKITQEITHGPVAVGGVHQN